MPDVDLQDLKVALRKSAYLKLAGWAMNTLGALGRGTKTVLPHALPAAGAAASVGLAGGDAEEIGGAGLMGAMASPLFRAAARPMQTRATRLGAAGDLARQNLRSTHAAATAPIQKHIDAPVPPHGDVSPEHMARYGALEAESAKAGTGEPGTRNPTQIQADLAALDQEVLAAQEASRAAAGKVTAANQAGQNRQAAAMAAAAEAKKALPKVEASTDATVAGAERARRDARAVGALAPVAAAGLGAATHDVGAGAIDTTKRAVGNVADRISSALASGKTDYVQLAKDYLPVVGAVGAVGALALWLMTRDDEEPEEKTAAVADDDPVRRAARNRRRIEGLLARNPKALDRVGLSEQALHDLPVALDARAPT